MAERVQGNSPSNLPIAPANVEDLKPVPLPQTDPHLKYPEFSPTLTALDVSPASTHTAAMTSESEYSGLSGGVEPSPLQQVAGAFSSLDHPNPGFYSQPYQRQHHDENPDVSVALTSLEPDEANPVPNPLPPPPPQDSRGPVSSMENEGYNTPRDALMQIEPSRVIINPFAAHGPLSASLQDRQEGSAKRREEVAKEVGALFVDVPTKLPPLQTGILGAVSVHERERKRKGGLGAVVTERERARRLAEVRQHKLDDIRKQQPEMAQNGLMYGSQLGPGSPAHVTSSNSGDDASQDSDSHKRKYRSSLAPPTQGLARPQTQRAIYQATAHRPGKSGGANGKGKRKARQDGWAESSSLAPVDTTATSVSKSGTPSAPLSSSCAEN